MTKLPYNGLYYDAMEWGYDGDPKSDRNRQNSKQQWFCNYHRLKRPPLSWDEECLETARTIRESTNLPIIVLLSGGIDSMVVAESFRLAGIPFIAATYKLVSPAGRKCYNMHDIKWAIDYCKYHSIKHKIIPLNIKRWWKNELIECAEIIQQRSPQFSVISWLIDQVDGYIVAGNGEPWWYVKDSKVWASDGEQYQGIEKWLIYRNREGTGKFFKYTTELKISGMIDPYFLSWIKSAVKLNRRCIEDQKEFIYNKYFNVGFRPEIEYERVKNPGKGKRKDYGGFEFLTKEDLKYRPRLEKMFPKEYNQFQDEPFLENLYYHCHRGDLPENLYKTMSDNFWKIEKYMTIPNKRDSILEKIWK